jgi:hypothetical protein
VAPVALQQRSWTGGKGGGRQRGGVRGVLARKDRRGKKRGDGIGWRLLTVHTRVAWRRAGEMGR